MTENEIAKLIVDAAYHVHRNLGPGLLESVYHRILVYELTKRGLKSTTQQSIPLFYDGLRFEEGFKADIIVEEKVLIELKSVEAVLPVHKKQLLTYMKLTGTRLGLLINFNDVLIKTGITRMVNGLEE